MLLDIHTHRRVAVSGEYILSVEPARFEPVDGCYYSVVDEKAFMEKMKEWHVELEDNKPEEIPPWKEQI